NVQAWIRLPFGLAYSLIPLAAGVGITVGGCMLDVAGTGNGNGALCQLSVVGLEACLPKLETTIQRLWQD
ncbi:MAG: hypothetical protein ABIR36_04370, partial [Nitrospiraceae bacterium]